MQDRIVRKLEILQSRSGAPYLGCYVSREDLHNYIKSMRTWLRERSVEFERNRYNRDGAAYHMTLVGPREYRSVLEMPRDRIEGILDRCLDLELVGLGRVASQHDEALFVVVNCDDGNQIRKELNLGSRDFHVTLGFADKDVHDLPKDSSSLLYV